MGALDLLRRIEAEPDRAFHTIEGDLRRLTGSPDGADEVLDHIEHSRRGEWFSRSRVTVS